jgi:hypothetical protein
MWYWDQLCQTPRGQQRDKPYREALRMELAAAGENAITREAKAERSRVRAAILALRYHLAGPTRIDANGRGDHSWGGPYPAFFANALNGFDTSAGWRLTLSDPVCSRAAFLAIASRAKRACFLAGVVLDHFEAVVPADGHDLVRRASGLGEPR